ncbi:glucosyltransferase domain-containing protein [Cronobacter sakazakii]
MISLQNKISPNATYKVAFAICLSFVAPILLANNYYYDDVARSLSGGLGWSQLGRPLSDAIFMVMSLNFRNSVDITPLPLIISTIVMSHGIVLLCKLFFEKTTILNLLICSSVFFTPFFIQNLSYRYDNLSMVASVYLCIWAAVLCKEKSLTNNLLSCLSLIFSLALYQTSFPSFCILCMGYVVLLAMKKREGYFCFLIRAISVTILSLVIYYIAASIFFDQTSRSNLIFNQQDWLGLLYRNIKNYLLMLKVGLSPVGLLAAKSSLIIATVSCFYVACSREFIYNRIEKVLFCIAVIFLPTFAVMLSSLISSVTIEGFMVPRVASSFGCSIFICLFFISLSGARVISSALCLTLLFNSLLSFYVVTSSIKNQHIKDMLVINRVASLISGDDHLRQVPVTFVGSLKPEMSAVNNSQIFGIAGLISSPFNDWMSALTLKKLSGVLVNYRMDRSGNQELANRILQSNDARIYCNSDFTVVSDGVQSVVLLGIKIGKCI